MPDSLLTPVVEQVSQKIYFLRGERVILDSDLAKVYGVETTLNRAVKRNSERFPDDFMFALTRAETENLRCQFGTSRSMHGGHRYLPYAFTEHGAIMAASVLNSHRAVEAVIFVVRAFVKLREILASNKELAAKLDELETRLDGHDTALRQIVTAIRELAAPLKERKSKRIGFTKPVLKRSN